MKVREIFITEFDKDRLDELVRVAEDFGGEDRSDLQDLKGELARANIVVPEQVPASVITMNSTVLLRDIESSEEMTYTLVFPKNADIGRGTVSVLAPIGMAILGYAEGDVVEWPVPSGMAQIAIEKVLYQPESSGDFHL
ncbi:MAG: nucleoside diphosphate kinase regulator [Pirellulales bacterium]